MIDNIVLLACNFLIFYAVFQLVKIEKKEAGDDNKKDRKKHG